MLMRAVKIVTPGARPSCSGENIRERFQAMETLHVSTPSCVQNTNKEDFPSRLAVEGVKQSGTHPFAHFLVCVLKWQRKKNLWNLAHRRVINRFVEIKFCCKCSGLGSIQKGDFVGQQIRRGKVLLNAVRQCHCTYRYMWLPNLLPELWSPKGYGNHCVPSKIKQLGVRKNCCS